MLCPIFFSIIHFLKHVSITDSRNKYKHLINNQNLTSRENRTCCFNSLLRAITLTNAYSSKPAKTKTRHADIQTSIAFIYDTRGNCDRIPKQLIIKNIGCKSYLRIKVKATS